MEDLISKKEVLEKYGISYGALYRWKRMGLIPEAWFIRKSTATGQETFFRRDQVWPPGGADPVAPGWNVPGTTGGRAGRGAAARQAQPGSSLWKTGLDGESSP